MDLGHIPHQVVIDFGRIDQHQLTAVGAKSDFDVFGAKPAEPVPMLHHDPIHRRVTQQNKELAAVPIERGTNLNNDVVDRDLFNYGPPSHPRYLPIPGPWTKLAGRLIHKNQPTHLPSWDRQPPSVKPPTHGHPHNTVALSHAAKFIHLCL